MGQRLSWCCEKVANPFSAPSVEREDDNTPKWKKMPFHEAFREALRTIDLSVHAKTVITIRYMENVLDIQKKNAKTLRSYNLHRVTILLSGLLVPVLFSVTNDVPSQATLFWFTLVVSLAGSISNAWIEYFGIIKLHYSYLSTCSSMESEGWNFASLSGPYRKYRRHDQCWRKFIHNAEKIHASGISRYMLNSQPANRSSSGKEIAEDAGVVGEMRRIVAAATSRNGESSSASSTSGGDHDFDPDEFVIQVN